MTAETSRRRRPAPRGLIAVVALVAALAGVGYGGSVLVRHWQVHTAAEEAVHAAEAYVLRLTDLDAEAIDDNFDAIAEGATGEFYEMHAQSRAKLRQQLVDGQVRARGQVVESAVKSASTDTVVVVLVVNQSVTNRDTPEPVVDRSRIRMTMNKVDGRWLAGKVEPL